MIKNIRDEIVVGALNGIVVASSIQGGRDTDINLYLVDFGDHMDVVASDNASNWIVGNENDAEENLNMIEVIGANRLEDFAETVVKHHDETLSGWIMDRINDACAAK